jgi:exonuclease SbcC
VILRRLRLHPFGCFADSEIAFTPGLNVVLGPNEAGKSTIFRAVRHALLVRAKLAKRDVPEHLDPYLPVAGGDTIRVELEFDAKDGRHVLRRRWGAKPGSELVLPGGGSLFDEEAIQARLRELLPAGRGTVANILMTEQARLAQTLEVLQDEKKAKEAVHDLADIMRRAVQATGGVNVDRFLERLGRDAEAAWSRWDRRLDGPEAGRGAENRWKRDVGVVLQAWYDQDDARAALAAAQEREVRLDEVNARLGSGREELGRCEELVKSGAASARDARERREVEANLRTAAADAAALAKVAAEWPLLAARAEELGRAEAEEAPRRAALEAEHAAAQLADSARSLREKQERVTRRKAQLDEAATALAGVPRLERRHLDEIRKAAADLARAEASAGAGMLTATVGGRAETEIVVQEDFGGEDRRKLAPGRTVRLRGAERIRIVHREMEIEIRSGAQDAGDRAERLRAARASLKALLEGHGVASLDEAEERARVFDARTADLRAAEKNLSDELAGESLETLLQRVAALAPVPRGLRPLAAVAAERQGMLERAGARTREHSDLSRRLGDMQREHGSPEKLHEQLAAQKAREAELAAKLRDAAPLPPGYADAEAFIKAFEAARERAATLRGELAGQEELKQSLERDAPELSPEELALRAEEARLAFKAVHRRAEALDRVLAKARALQGTDGQAMFSQMNDRLSGILSAMTLGRHREVAMEGALPTGLGDASGARVRWDQLSTGTKDSLALALRLAMASYFLADTDGFVLMDDPLVDMDPDRQAAAAGALRDFASGRQLVLLTCHPGAVDLLGGNLIRLEASAR